MKIINFLYPFRNANWLNFFFIGMLSLCLCACSCFFDKDNTPPPSPLVNFKPSATVTQNYRVKTNSGVGSDYLKLGAAVTDTLVYTADKKGDVTASNKLTGKKLWEVNIGIQISAGPAANDQIIVVGSRHGDVVALNPQNGSIRWQTKASSEILARPTIQHNIVLIKAIDGNLSAFDGNDGHALWHYQQTEPSLILRNSSSIQAEDDMLIAGFANGNLAKLTLANGSLQWQTPIAHPQGSFAIERMIDIDADPIISGQTVFAATYQGHIASLNLLTGREYWSHDLSSYTGMTADRQNIYVTDAKSDVWAFDRENGAVRWRQDELSARNTTGPVSMGRFIVVGDAEGYLHWLNKEDGRMIARTRVDTSGILATPVIDNRILYVVTTNGHLATYTIR